MSHNYGNLLSHPASHEILYRLVGLYSSTFRMTVVNEGPWMRHLEAGGSVIICAFHQQFFSAIRYFRAYRNLRPSLMISKSRDGDIIAGVAERTGWQAVRGSSSRGGSEALKVMLASMKTTRICGHVVDGPRGPFGGVKMGLIKLAQASGAVIAPFFVTADRAWYFNSWDRFQLPKPFAKVTLRYEDPIKLAKTTDRDRMEQQRAEIEQFMKPGLIQRPN